MNAKPAVFLVDDDGSVLVALSRTLRLESYDVRGWTSARQFLKEHDPSVAGCLVCDLVMPDMNGLELRRELLRRGSCRPMIFLTGKSDVRSAVQGMRSGAVRFLAKPVMRSELLRAVKEAVDQDNIARTSKRSRSAKSTASFVTMLFPFPDRPPADGR